MKDNLFIIIFFKKSMLKIFFDMQRRCIISEQKIHAAYTGTKSIA